MSACVSPKGHILAAISRPGQAGAGLHGFRSEILGKMLNADPKRIIIPRH